MNLSCSCAVFFAYHPFFVVLSHYYVKPMLQFAIIATFAQPVFQAIL